MNPQFNITTRKSVSALLIIACFSGFENCHSSSFQLGDLFLRLKQDARNGGGVCHFEFHMNELLDGGYELIQAHYIIKCLIRSKN